MKKTSLTLLMGVLGILLTMSAGQAAPVKKPLTKPNRTATSSAATARTQRWQQGITHARTWQTSKGGKYQKSATVTPAGHGAYNRNGTFSNTFPNGRTHSGTFQGTGQVTHSANSVTNNYSGTRTYKDGQTVDVNHEGTATKTTTGFDTSTSTTITTPNGKPVTTVTTDTTHVKGQGNTTDATITGPEGHSITVDSSSARTGPGTFEQQATVKDGQGQVLGGDQATGTVQVQNGSLVQTIQGTTDHGGQFSGTSTTAPNGDKGLTTTSSGTVTGPNGATVTGSGTSTTSLTPGGVTTSSAGTVTGPNGGTVTGSGTSTTSLTPGGVTTTSSGAVTGANGATVTGNGTSTTSLKPVPASSNNTASPGSNTTRPAAGGEGLPKGLGLTGPQVRQIFQVLSSTKDPAERQSRIRAILTPDQLARWNKTHPQQQ